jgi:putative Holliday junction resolvase
VVAVDLGERRIGVAVCDSAGTVALPREVITRGADPAQAAAAIRRVVVETGATTVVVGLPVSLDGTHGPAAARARAEADELGRGLEGVEVVLFDERLTTVSANNALAEAGQRGRQRRERVDAAAAAVLLQAWLDAGRPGR